MSAAPMLSAGGRRNVYHRPSSAALAEREAREVLATAEPQIGDVEWSHVSYRRAAQITRNGVILDHGLDRYGEALSDSLSAFVAAVDVVAFLQAAAVRAAQEATR